MPVALPRYGVTRVCDSTWVGFPRCSVVSFRRGTVRPPLAERRHLRAHASSLSFTAPVMGAGVQWVIAQLLHIGLHFGL